MRIICFSILLFFVLMPFRSTEAFTGSRSSVFSGGKKPAKLSPYEDKTISDYRKNYSDKAAAELKAGNPLSACIIYQKLLALLSDKLSTGNADNWMDLYGKYYQETSRSQQGAKKSFDRERIPLLKKYYNSAQKERSAALPEIPSVYRRLRFPADFSLSLDSKIALKVVPSESFFYSAASLISFIAMPDKIKFYEELPIPDDSLNPQISRWGKNYKVTSAKLSPTDLHYAYILNGALCLNSIESPKPRLFSAVPDKSGYNDLSFEWAVSGRYILYTRVVHGTPSIYFKEISGGGEYRVAKGTAISISSDGSKIIGLADGVFTVYNAENSKVLCTVKSDFCAFSYSGSKVIYSKHSKKGLEIFEKTLADKKERFLCLLKNLSANTKITSAAALCPNLYALTASDSNLYIISASGASKVIPQIGGALNNGSLQTPFRIVCNGEVVLLKN